MAFSSFAEFTLESGPAVLSVRPEMGGRISSLTWEGTELLFINENVENWGSTFWTSPQSTWNWPPPQALDKGPYTEQATDDGHIIESAEDNATGFKFVKSFKASLSDTSFDITYSIVNVSTSQKQAAPWEITRFASGGMIFYPSGEDTKTGDLSQQILDAEGVSWYKYDSNSVPGGTPKLFDDGSEGWLCHVSNTRYIVLKKFEDSPVSAKAPGENEIELYISPARDYQEMEQQGPYTTLQPGDSLNWTVKWLPKKLPEDLTMEVGNADLAEYARTLSTPPVSLLKSVSKSEFHIYKNSLSIPASIKGSLELEIFNLRGQSVYSQTAAPTSNLGLPQLPQGIYKVKISNQGTTTQLKWFNLH